MALPVVCADMTETTMTGSWFRPEEVLRLLPTAPGGELPEHHHQVVEAAERRAIRDQLHPNGSEIGLTWVSNGEQRKAGYTSYLPNRYHGFSHTENVQTPFPRSLIEEFTESNPLILQQLSKPESATAFALPKIVQKLEYEGERLALKEAKDAARLAREEGAPHVFVPSASPGVITTFFPNNKDAYRDHLEYLAALTREQSKEYRTILSVDGVDLQIDSPDLAMAKQTAGDWDIDFFDALPYHIDAINESVKGLPSDRIRVHYCYGNWVGSHRFDAEFERVIRELTRLKVGTIVGEFANPRHQGDVLHLKRFVKEHGWPDHLRFAVGVIDVKTPIVETPETVRDRLDRVGDIIGGENVLGGTDCGFETFAHFGNVSYSVGLLKLEALAKGGAGID